MKSIKIALVAGAALLLATPAMAQKSKDTLRIAINDPFPGLSMYSFAFDEAAHFYRRVYQDLFEFDERNHTVVPQLATSWKQVDDLTLELDLRDDVKFHNGDAFSADDVVTTLKYVSDPNVQMVNKVRYAWMSSIEKLGPYKVRIKSSTPNSIAMSLLAYVTPILDGKVLEQQKNDYGRLTPYGTGVYKVNTLDNTGITVEAYDGFKGDPKYMKAGIKYVRAIPVPNRQTQQAQMMTGGLDMLRNVEPDVAKNFASNPNLAITVVPTGYIMFFGLDAGGRSKLKPLTDQRVRQAIWQAIDRDAIIKTYVPGGDSGAADKMKGLCFDFNVACKIGTPAPEFDLTKAKALMAEAGYANGFDMDFAVFPPIQAVGEAIAGELRKINVNMKVSPVPFSVYVKQREGGELNSFLGFYPTSVNPDTTTTLNVFFGGNSDYSKDPQIADLLRQSASELNLEKRTGINQKALDLSNKNIYTMAFSSLPTIYVHSKDVQINKDSLNAVDTYINDYSWK